MIGLLIQDNAYEQDIRELLMSFYPGETYAHEVRDELWFYVETRLGQGEISVLIWDRDGGGDGGRNGTGSGQGRGLSGRDKPGGRRTCILETGNGPYRCLRPV